jgi:hypothetical protein
MLNEKKLSKAELAKREDLIMSMKKNKRNLVKKYGSDAEKVMYGRATNLAKKLAEQDMEQNKLREMVRAALMQSVSEKKEFPDLTGDGKVTKADILKARGVELKEEDVNAILKAKAVSDEDIASFLKLHADDIKGKNAKEIWHEFENFETTNEDIDLGHQDNEPHMIKAELYRIGKYAMELYQMLDGFEGEMEVDFPAWWQAKLTTAMNNMVSAKHYLDFEIKEPEIDAAVNAMTDVEPEMEPEMEPQVMTVDLVDDEDEIEEGLPKGFWKKETAELDESAADNLELKNVAKQLYLGFQKMGADVELSKPGKVVLNKRPADGNMDSKDVFLYSEDDRVIANLVGDKAIGFYDKIQKGFPQFEFIDGGDGETWNGAKIKKLIILPGKTTSESVDESFEKLVGKLEKQGKSKKAATAIAGAIASYKAKGGGKGPTKKQQAK